MKKYEIKSTLKTPISQLFNELEKISKYSLRLYSKNTIFHPSPKLEKTERSIKSNIRKS